MAPYAALKAAGEITEEDLKSIKLEVIKEEASRFATAPAYDYNGRNMKFSSEDIKRQPPTHRATLWNKKGKQESYRKSIRLFREPGKRNWFPKRINPSSIVVLEEGQEALVVTLDGETSQNVEYCNIYFFVILLYKHGHFTGKQRQARWIGPDHILAVHI
eukprot:gene12027-8280_t